MVGTKAHEPEDDDILVHRDDGKDVYFSTNINYGHGQPHFYVGLYENGGEGSWWLDHEQAERLGKDLLDLGTRCRQLNIKEDQRRAELAGNQGDRP